MVEISELSALHLSNNMPLALEIITPPGHQNSLFSHLFQPKRIAQVSVLKEKIIIDSLHKCYGN